MEIQNRLLSEAEVVRRISDIHNMMSDSGCSRANIEVDGDSFWLEYLVIPAVSKQCNNLPPIFVYPGGGTHLGPCFEHLIYLDRRIFVISPLGYGRSSLVPKDLLENNMLYGTKVAFKFLKGFLWGVEDIEVFFHTNAAPIGMNMIFQANDFGINIVKATFCNPLGLRKLPWICPVLAFPIFGALSRFLSWGVDYPWKHLKRAYGNPLDEKPSKSEVGKLGMMAYEIQKSCEPLTKFLLECISSRWDISTKIVLVQSRWDWARWHCPWTKSNEQIFRDNIPVYNLITKEIPGLHNATLGKNSLDLAKAMAEE